MIESKITIKEITNTHHNIQLLYGKKDVETICGYLIEYILGISNGLYEIFVPTCEIYQSNSKWFMSQKTIYGETLRNYITNCTDIQSIIEIFKFVLMDILQLYNNSLTICIDMNLENFIIKNNKIFLIDVIPPILLDKVQKDNIDNDLLYMLFCKRDYHLTAFLYYVLKSVILNKRLDLNQKQYTCSSIFRKFETYTNILISEEYLPFNIFIDDLFAYLSNAKQVNYNIVLNNSFREFYSIRKNGKDYD